MLNKLWTMKIDNIWLSVAGLIWLALFIVSCAKPVQQVESESGYGKYRVEVIDGCQYLSYGWSLAHKGNCTNSIHIYRVENK